MKVCDVKNMGVICGVAKRKRRDAEGLEEEVETADLGTLITFSIRYNILFRSIY